MANRTVNQLPGTLDRTTISGADKLLVDDVSDLETKNITVDELTAHITAQTTAQQTYDAGAAPSITIGARGPLQLRTPTPDGSSPAITTYAAGIEAASLTPAGLRSAQPLLVAPDDQPAGNDGWPTIVRGGNGGVGASLGGTVQVQAGEVLGGGQDGDVLIGTEHATAIQLGKTGDGSSVQITGDLSVQSGAGGAQTARISAASPSPDAIVLDATDPAGGVSLRVNGDEVLGVTAAGITGRAPIETEAGTARSVASVDSGKIVRCTAATTVTITVPWGLQPGTTVEYVQAGNGRLRVVAGAGMTLLYGADVEYSRRVVVTVLDPATASVGAFAEEFYRKSYAIIYRDEFAAPLTSKWGNVISGTGAAVASPTPNGPWLCGALLATAGSTAGGYATVRSANNQFYVTGGLGLRAMTRVTVRNLATVSDDYKVNCLGLAIDTAGVLDAGIGGFVYDRSVSPNWLCRTGGVDIDSGVAVIDGDATQTRLEWALTATSITYSINGVQVATAVPPVLSAKRFLPLNVVRVAGSAGGQVALQSLTLAATFDTPRP